MSMQYGAGEFPGRADSDLIPAQEFRSRGSRERVSGEHAAPTVLASRGASRTIDVEPIDPIPELEQQLMHALHGGPSEQLNDGDRPTTRTPVESWSSATGPVGSSGEKDMRTAAAPEGLPQGKAQGSRGAANFQAWLETRRKLDGEDAEFVIEYRAPDGQVSQVNLMRLKYQDLPAPVQAAFERRKFPDLSALVNASPPIPPRTESPAVRTVLDGQGREQDAERRSTPQESNSENPTEDNITRDEDTADAETYGRPRYGQIPAGSGLGISFGGLSRGAQRVAQVTGRVANGTGRAAVKALAEMREGLGVTSGKQREWIGQRLRSWREGRANQALEALARMQVEFDTALRSAHEHPELKKHFRSWNVPRTAATRQRAIKRFHEAVTSGSLGQEAAEQIRSLFDRAEVLQAEATRAMRRVESAGHSVDDVQRRFAGWLKRMSERAGPLTNLEGESLGEKLRQMADAISRLFEKVADRIARLTAVRPT